MNTPPPDQAKAESETPMTTNQPKQEGVETPVNNRQWEARPIEIQLRCSHGVWLVENNGLLCYTTSEERAQWIAKCLHEGAAAIRERDELAKKVEELESQREQWRLSSVCRESKQNLSDTLDVLEKCRTSLDCALSCLQFWLEHARGDGEVEMPSAAHTTFHTRKEVQIGIDAAQQLLTRMGRKA